LNEIIAVPARAREALLQSSRENKVTFLRAGPGWGKTAAVQSVLAPRQACYVPVRPGAMPRFPAREALVVLDDYQNLSPRLVDYMAGVLRRSPARQRLVILSRAPLPGHLARGGFEGGLCRLDGRDLALGEGELSRLAEERGFSLAREELRVLSRACRGHPVLARLLLDEAALGQALDDAALERARRRLGLYLDRVLFCRLEPEAQKLLLYTALFDEFTPELAACLTQSGWSGERLCALEGAGAPIESHRGRWALTGRPLLPDWLREKAGAELGCEKVKELYAMAGRWYAGRGELEAALGCCAAAGAREDAAALLSRDARERGEVWHIARLGPWYRRLTRDEAAGDPALLYSLGLLDLLELDVEGARGWCGGLSRLTEAGCGEAGEYLARLESLLPEGRAAPRRDVTAMGWPSLLRGCRDLSEMMAGGARRETEQALGGETWELLRAEWELERDGDAAGLCLRLAALQQRLEGEDARFICAMLLARALCAGGQADQAASMLARQWERTAGDGGPEVRNLEALRCRVSLLRDGQYADEWLSRQGGAEDAPFLPDLFRGLTMARCRVRRGEYSAALSQLGRTLERLEGGFRPLDQMEALVLAAVASFRAESGEWEGCLRRALEIRARYGYTAALSGEGAALLPLLARYQGAERGRAGWDRLLERTVAQAQRYPGYLRCPGAPLARLTPREMMVYRLLQLKKTNAEVGEILGIRPNTVKSHKRSIDAKLKAFE